MRALKTSSKADGATCGGVSGDELVAGRRVVGAEGEDRSDSCVRQDERDRSNAMAVACHGGLSGAMQLLGDWGELLERQRHEELSWCFPDGGSES
jgi:hypothetical protein